MQCSRGFIWISTAEGLVRFDGQKFSVYRHNREDSNSMPYDGVGCCIEIDNQELIFSCGLKLWMFNTVSKQQHAPPLFWQKKLLHGLYSVHNNLIAIQSADKIYFTNTHLQVLDYVKVPAAGIKNIFYLGERRFLLSTGKQTFWYSLKNKKTGEWKISVIPFHPDDVYDITQVDTASKIIYAFGYIKGAFKISYDTANPLFLNPLHLSYSYIGSIKNVFFKDGTLVVAGEWGLSIVQPGYPPMIIQNLAHNSNGLLPGIQTKTIADKSDNFWAVGVNGISRFNLQQSNYIYWKLPYTSPLTIERYEKSGKNLWMCNQSKGSMYLDTKMQQLHIIDSTIVNNCWGIKPVTNNLYIYGNSTLGKYASNPYNVKLLAYNPSNKKITKPSFLNAYTKDAELITLIYKTHNGDVWYSINRGGGLVRQQANKFTHYSRNTSASSCNFSYVNIAAEDTAGNIYFTVNKSNHVLVWKSKAQHLEEWKMDSLMHVNNNLINVILCHVIDKNQNLWMSFEQTGLLKYNLSSGKGKLYTLEDGLQSNSFDCMVSDDAGNIWIPSEKGLGCLLAATDKFVNFTAEDGLPFTNFHDCYLYFDKDDGSLYFSKEGYLYKMNAAQLLRSKKQHSAKLFIDAMQVNGNPYYFSNISDIQLQPNENNLQFTFTLLDLGQTIQQKNYEYLLTRNNEKSNWQKLNTVNVVAFNDLKPGAYMLQVRMPDEAINSYITGSNFFHFTITTVWYKTAWFIGLYIAAGAFIIWAFIRLYYQKKLEQQKALLEKEKALEEERNRIAADMHDDIGAGLSRIRYITSAMKEGKGLDNNDVDKIMSLSDESIEKMNEIIWSLNQGNRNLDELIYYIRSQCATLVSNANLAFVCELPPFIPQQNLGWNESRNMYMLAKEAVNNAIKHAEASLITLDFSFQNDFVIAIADNGKGFNAASANKDGNGLKNYEKRTAAFHGTFSIDTSPGTGTKVIFRFILTP